jgi:ribonuclease HI
MRPTVEYNSLARHYVARWECCGLLWEMMLSSLFPDRRDFAPTRLRCGGMGTSVNQERRKAGRVRQYDYIVYFDGGSKGNPGLGYGSYLLMDVARQTKRLSRVEFGNGITNNVAEYKTLEAALTDLRLTVQGNGEQTADRTVLVMGDSMLVVKQVQEKWCCRDANLMVLRNAVQRLLAGFASWQVTWQPRDVSVAILGH